MRAMTFGEALIAVLKDGAGVAAKAQFNAKVAEIAAREGRGRADAMRKARMANPALFDTIQAVQLPVGMVEKAASGDPARREARARFVTKAREIAARDGIGRAAAMRRVRVEHPDLMAAAHD